jgi:hypothetical protein
VKRTVGGPRFNENGDTRCTHCGEWKPPTDYFKWSGRTCKLCARERERRRQAGNPVSRERKRLSAARWKVNNPELQRRRNRIKALRLYRLSVEQFETMVASRGGVCEICGKPPRVGRRLVVDHDRGCCPHARTCGTCIRGLLCVPCNASLGLLERPAWLSSAMAYLEKTTSRAREAA